jgi:O-antigen/teichoic acid export membrane protein
MRVYIAGMVPLVIEMGSLVLLLREGRFALMVTSLALVVSVGLSWTGAHHLGLAGAAAGSVAAVYLDRLIMLRRVARRTGIPLGRLQQWSRLLLTLGAAACAGVLAWAIVGRWLPGAHEMVRLLVGAGIVAAAYLPWLAVGLRRAA